MCWWGISPLLISLTSRRSPSCASAALRGTSPVLSQEGSDATMDFSYTPRMAELRRTAQDLVGVIVKYENECERNNGLGPDTHRAIREAVLASGLQAINVPVQWGGAGLTVLEQVVVSE